MYLKSLGLTACMLACIVGCAKKESDDSKSVSDSKSGAPPRKSNGTDARKSNGGNPGNITVKLLDPGVGPRSLLRYKFQAGRTDKMVMDMSMAMAMEIGGQKRPETRMPVTRMTMTFESKNVSTEGDLQYEFKMGRIDVLPDPGVDPRLVNAMKQQMRGMQGLSGSATVTSRGFTRDAAMKIPPGINPQVKQFMDNMKNSMHQMSAPLPEEPVGKGARWQVTMPIETPALKLTQIATYTLKEIQGDKVKFDVTLTQSAPPQEMHPPGAAPGMTVSLKSFNTSGTGTVEMHLTNLVPTSNMNMSTMNVVSANNRMLTTRMRMGMKIHP